MDAGHWLSGGAGVLRSQVTRGNILGGQIIDASGRALASHGHAPLTRPESLSLITKDPLALREQGLVLSGRKFEAVRADERAVYLALASPAQGFIVTRVSHAHVARAAAEGAGRAARLPRNNNNNNNATNANNNANNNPNTNNNNNNNNNNNAQVANPPVACIVYYGGKIVPTLAALAAEMVVEEIEHNIDAMGIL